MAFVWLSIIKPQLKGRRMEAKLHVMKKLFKISPSNRLLASTG